MKGVFLKKILVTGGAGFIGTEVVKLLLVRGYRVRVVDNLSKKDSILPKHKNLEFIKADLTSWRKCDQAFKGMDICINLAAKIGGIGYFHKYPATILSENNKLYSNTFEAAVKHKIKRMVQVSSSMVFESTNRYPSREEDITKIPPPITAYGFSKLTGEWYCRAFEDEFGLEYAIARPFNAYGINELPEKEVGYAHVVPDLVKKILDGQYPLEILGSGRQIRCYTHVSDVAAGILAVAFKPAAKNEAFNISSSRPTTVLELAKLLWKLCGKDPKKFKIKHLPAFKHDVQKRIPSVIKAKKLLGWQAKIKLEEGLKDVVNWLKTKQNK